MVLFDGVLVFDELLLDESTDCLCLDGMVDHPACQFEAVAENEQS